MLRDVTRSITYTQISSHNKTCSLLDYGMLRNTRMRTSTGDFGYEVKREGLGREGGIKIL